MDHIVVSMILYHNDYKTEKRNDTTDINEYLNLQIHENENFLALQMEKDEELRQFYANEKIRLAHVSLS